MDRFWAYHNWVHRYTKIHGGDCTFCNDGAGIQQTSENVAGEWLGPFATVADARDVAARTRTTMSHCKVCAPIA